MLDTPALLHVLDGQTGGLLATQTVVQQHRQNSAITQPQEGGRIWRFKQRLGLVITEGRRLAFVSFNLRTLYPVHWVSACDSVGIEQVIEQAGQGRQLAADGGTGQAALFQLAAPGEDVGAGDRTKLIGRVDAKKAAEVLDVTLVSAAGARVVQVCKPLGRGRHLGQALELGCSKPALGKRNARGVPGRGGQIIHPGNL